MPVKKTKQKIRHRRTKKIKEQKIAGITDGYVSINNYDPEAESKKKILYLIVSVLALVVVGFWFWTMKLQVAKDQNSNKAAGLEQEITRSAAELKNFFELSQQKAATLDQIKNEVISQIEFNADSASWPTHTSRLLQLSVQYPADWTKQENATTLTLRSTTTPLTITIKKYSDNAGLDSWLIKNNPTDANYQLSSEASPLISGQPSQKYSDANDYLLYVAQAKNIYEIKISGGTVSNAPLIERVLQTIKLLS